MDMGQKQYVTDIVLTAPLHAVNTSASIAEVQMPRSHSIAVIGGDGIGPEVTRAALRVLDAAERRFTFSTSRTEYAWSSARYVESGERVGEADIDQLRRHEAILFGAIGDPRAPR